MSERNNRFFFGVFLFESHSGKKNSVSFYLTFRIICGTVEVQK